MKKETKIRIIQKSDKIFGYSVITSLILVGIDWIFFSLFLGINSSVNFSEQIILSLDKSPFWELLTALILLTLTGLSILITVVSIFVFCIGLETLECNAKKK